MLVGFIFLLGTYATMKMDVELFPKIDFDQAIVMIDTDELPATDVEQLVTIPTEQMLTNVAGVKSYQSSSTTRGTSFTIEIDSGKGDEVTKELQSEVSSLAKQIPQVNDIFVMQISTDNPYEFYMDITGGTMVEMSEFANQVVKKRLEDLPQVREVLLVGTEEKEIVISLNVEKMNEFGIQPDFITSAIQQTNTSTSIGTLTKETGKPTLRLDTTFKSIADIKNINIPYHEGTKKLAEIATITEETNEQSQVAWRNGDTDFILLQIGRTKDYTQLDMSEAVRTEISKIKQEGLLENMQVGEIVSQADYVRNAIDGVVDNILIGGVIAIIVLLLFLRNIRATMIIGLSIPASILLTMLMMNLFGYSLNLASLIGLGLGIGMLVDASIVVLESIYKKKRQGIPNKTAVISGTKEVFTAVISSMLTTIVVFLPIGILDDDVGQIVFVLAIVIALTLVCSVVIAFTWIPALAENFLKVKVKKTKQNRGIIYRYGQLVAWITKKRRRSVGIITLFFAVFISSFLLVTKIPMTVMPDIFNRYAEVMIELEPGVAPEQRKEIALEVHEQLQNITDVAYDLVIDNDDMLITLINMTPEDEQTMEQVKVNEEIMRSLRQLEKDYPIVNVLSSTEGTFGLPVQLTISGESLAGLEEVSKQVTAELQNINGIRSVVSDANHFSEELLVQWNEVNLQKDHISKTDVQQQMTFLFQHVPVGSLVKDG